MIRGPLPNVNVRFGARIDDWHTGQNGETAPYCDMGCPEKIDSGANQEADFLREGLKRGRKSYGSSETVVISLRFLQTKTGSVYFILEKAFS
jgi:hypothetical protein